MEDMFNKILVDMNGTYIILFFEKGRMLYGAKSNNMKKWIFAPWQDSLFSKNRDNHRILAEQYNREDMYRQIFVDFWTYSAEDLVGYDD